MNDDYGFICPSLNNSLIGKVIKHNDKTNYYLLQMPKKKKYEEDKFYYTKVDLHEFIDKWIEIKILKYTDFGVKYEIKKITKKQANSR